MPVIDRPSTSASMLELAKDGDSEAWARLTSIYGPIVFNLCEIRGLADSDASDVTQDTFIAIYKSLHQFRKNKPNHRFLNWVIKIANNRIYDFFRSAKRNEIAIGGDDGQEMANTVVDPNYELSDQQISEFVEREATRIRQLLQQDFEENTYSAFYKTVVEDKTPAEAGEELGMSSGAVRIAKMRVLNRAKQEFGDFFGPEE